MAAFYVSGDADDHQGVDAGQAEEQREEPVHLGTQSRAAESCVHTGAIQPSSTFSAGRRCFTNALQTQDTSSEASCGIRKLKQKLSLWLLFLYNSLMEFRVWGDYLLIMALVKGNYSAGLGSRAKSATPSAPLCQFQVTWLS